MELRCTTLGVKRDGLVHVSQLSDEWVSDPREVVHVGQVVRVRVLEVDRQRGRISLSMRSAEAASPSRPAKAAGGPAAGKGAAKKKAQRASAPRPAGARPEAPRPRPSRQGPATVEDLIAKFNRPKAR